MSFFLDSFTAACRLVWALDPELFTIVRVSLSVSCLATVIAAAAGIPLGFFVAYGRVPGRRAIITLLNTLLALPTVVIGQVILIVPLIAALTVAAVSRVDERYRRTAQTLGAGPWQTALVVLREGRFGIAAAVISAFGRVISEIGISMMLGGNIKGFTRTMTTAMALEYDKGAFTLAVALGLVLMAISLGMNVVFNLVQGRAGR